MRCGTVAIFGRPNVGKSTLLNRYLGQKIAIVSPKPETTRQKLLGILTLPDAQVLFLDTPGIYSGPKTLLAKHQIQAARDALGQADFFLMMTDAAAGFTDEDRELLRLLPKPISGEKPAAFLGINKVDRVRKDRLLPQIAEAQKAYPFRKIVPISAAKGDNTQPLLELLIASLPEGPAAYPADQVTDTSMRVLAQELIREKALLFTHEEIPHSVAVLVEEWRPGTASPRQPSEKSSSTYIRANIYLERDSQKGILIGKDGALLKRIGQEARREIEKLLDGPVYLDLWVKIAKNWRKDAKFLREIGF